MSDQLPSSTPHRALEYAFDLSDPSGRFRQALRSLRTVEPHVGPCASIRISHVRHSDDSDDEPATWVLRIGDGQPFRTADPGALLHQLVYEITRRAVASVRDPVLHAAAASVGGSGVLISGASGTGKSTLLCALADRGHLGLTDEAVVVGPSGSVTDVVARPVHLDGRSMSLLAREPRPLDIPMPGGGAYVTDVVGRFDSAAPPPRVPVAVVLLEPPAGPLSVDEPTRARGLAGLVRESFPGAARSQRGLSSLKELATSARFATVRGGTPSDRAKFVEEFVGPPEFDCG